MTRTPLWQSIADRLATEIASGHYAPGDRLPTEAALAARFGVNRHTVRRALAGTAAAGLTHARRGAGVFVLSRPTDYPIGRRPRFHQSLAEAGHAPERRVLHLGTRAADAAEAEALDLPPGASVHAFESVNLADGVPISIALSVFPADRFPALPGSLAANPSITAALATAGVADYTRALTRITAVRAGPTEALHLRLPEGAPLVRTEGINVDGARRPVEFGRAWFAGDRVTLVLRDDGPA